MNKCKVLLNLPRVIPHLLCYVLSSDKRDTINQDLLARPPTLSRQEQQETFSHLAIMLHAH